MVARCSSGVRGRTRTRRFGWPLQVLEHAGNEPALEAPDAFVRALRAAMGEEAAS